MDETIPRMVLARCDAFGDGTAMRRKDKGVYRNISWNELGRQIRTYGRALQNLGLEPGERVAIMAPNTPEWAYADLGIMAAAGVSVPIYHTEGADTILHIARDSGSRFLFLHSPLLARELVDHLDDLPTLNKIIQISGRQDHERFLSLDEFLAGADFSGAEDLEQTLQDGRRDHLASLVYTSGTTGTPKGVMLTHDNILSNIEACADLFPIDDKDQCLSFLPLSHVFERVDGYYFMLRQGVTIAYAESIDTVPANLQEIRPTVMISVPRLYEKMYARVMERVLSSSWLRKQIFFSAVQVGKAAARREMAGGQPGFLLRLGRNVASRVVFSKLRERLGGNLRFFISGGAPLGSDIAEFFLAAGIPILEGYGLTETAGGITVNTFSEHRLGTVGKVFSNIDIRLADDGEILLKGRGVFRGYWNLPEETDQALSGGWFHTGDIGTLDEEGFLAITDRKKDLIVTAGGENIAPQSIENRLKEDKFIANAMVYGDRKAYLVALIVPNIDNLERFARHRNLDFLNHCDLVNHPGILELLRGRIDALQEDLPSIQRIKRFTLLSQDFSRSEVTPTLKVRRKVVREHFGKVLEGMYLAEDHGIHDSGFCIVEEDTEG